MYLSIRETRWILSKELAIHENELNTYKVNLLEWDQAIPIT